MSSPLVLTIEHRFTHSCETLWRAWTDPDWLKQWAWGVGMEARASVDLQRGGRWEVYAHFPKAEGQWRSTWWGQLGMYVEIEPARKLVFTTHWDGPVGYNQIPDQPAIDELITLTFTPEDEGCIMRYEHMGVPDAESLAAHESAMREVFKQLAKHLPVMIGE